jgi:hypothetical protein
MIEQSPFPELGVEELWGPEPTDEEVAAAERWHSNVSMWIPYLERNPDHTSEDIQVLLDMTFPDYMEDNKQKTVNEIAMFGPEHLVNIVTYTVSVRARKYMGQSE